jgi:hypothetical protein
MKQIVAKIVILVSVVMMLAIFPIAWLFGAVGDWQVADKLIYGMLGACVLSAAIFPIAVGKPGEGYWSTLQKYFF